MKKQRTFILSLIGFCASPSLNTACAHKRPEGQDEATRMYAQIRKANEEENQTTKRFVINLFNQLKDGLMQRDNPTETTAYWARKLGDIVREFEGNREKIELDIPGVWKLEFPELPAISLISVNDSAMPNRFPVIYLVVQDGSAWLELDYAATILLLCHEKQLQRIKLDIVEPDDKPPKPTFASQSPQSARALAKEMIESILEDCSDYQEFRELLDGFESLDLSMLEGLGYRLIWDSSPGSMRGMLLSVEGEYGYRISAFKDKEQLDFIHGLDGINIQYVDKETNNSINLKFPEGWRKRNHANLDDDSTMWTPERRSIARKAAESKLDEYKRWHIAIIKERDEKEKAAQHMREASATREAQLARLPDIIKVDCFNSLTGLPLTTKSIEVNKQATLKDVLSAIETDTDMFYIMSSGTQKLNNETLISSIATGECVKLQCSPHNREEKYKILKQELCNMLEALNMDLQSLTALEKAPYPTEDEYKKSCSLSRTVSCDVIKSINRFYKSN